MSWLKFEQHKSKVVLKEMVKSVSNKLQTTKRLVNLSGGSINMT